VLKPSHDELLAVLERHPLLEDSVVRSERPLGITQSLLGAIHYVASHHLVQPNPERADAFVKVFLRGAPDYDGDPAHKMREFALRERGKGNIPRDRVIYASAAWAWNHFVDRKPVNAYRPPMEAQIHGLITRDL
jgi:hypothetical protein